MPDGSWREAARSALRISPSPVSVDGYVGDPGLIRAGLP